MRAVFTKITTGVRGRAMFSKAFAKGFRYELANREFALRVVTRMADQASGVEQRSFWSTYSRLERFNAMHYRAAAQSWGFAINSGYVTRLRAWAAGWLLLLLHGVMLKFIYAETVKYVDVLKNLRNIGPADAALFLNYVVEQEELQVKMMQMAFTERFSEIDDFVDAFFLKYNGVLPRASGVREFET